MKLRYVVAFLLAFAISADALPTRTKRKTYADGEIFTAADYNADIDESVVWINALNAKFPGLSPNDSLTIPIVSVDTLVANALGKIMVSTAIFSVNSGDSLVYDWIHVDTLWIGSGGSPIVGFVGGATAGNRLTFGSLVAIDTLRIRDSMTVSGPATFLGNASFTGTLTLDTLTVTGPTTVDTFTSTSLAILDTARIDSLRTTNATVLTKFSVGATATITPGHATLDTIATDSLTVIGPSSLIGAVGVTGNVTVTGDLSATDLDGIIGSNTPAAGTFTNLTSTALTILDTVRADSLRATNATVLTLFSVGATATIRPGHAKLDSIATDSLTVIGPVTISGGSGSLTLLGTLSVIGDADVSGTFTVGNTATITPGHAELDTIATDSLTVIGPATFLGNASFTGTLTLDTLTVTGPTTVDTFTSTSIAILDTARIDSLRATNATVLTKFSVGATATITPGHATLDTIATDSLTVIGPITATGKVAFSSAPSVLLPAAITMPSGTDGYVLTSDGNGVVALEAVPVGAADTDSTLSNAGGSTVALRVDENGNILTAAASPLYIGGTPVVGYSLAQTAGTRAFLASVTSDTTTSLRAVFSSASSVLLPATGTKLPTGIDGYVLTSDGRGAMALEAIPAGAVDTDSTLAKAGTSTVGLRVNAAGAVFINDTANTFQTIGLTITGGAANSDENITVKNPSMAHTFTDRAEADNFFTVQRYQQSDGGALINGYIDASGDAGHAILMQGFVSQALNATKTTAGYGAITLQAGVTDGAAGATAAAGDANLVNISNWGTTQFILDADGDSHQNVGTAWTNFDHADDAMILRDAMLYFSPETAIKSEFDDFSRNHEEEMIRAKIIPRLTAEQKAAGERPLTNTTQLLRLTTMTAFQNYDRARTLDDRLSELENDLSTPNRDPSDLRTQLLQMQTRLDEQAAEIAALKRPWYETLFSEN